VPERTANRAADRVDPTRPAHRLPGAPRLRRRHLTRRRSPPPLCARAAQASAVHGVNVFLAAAAGHAATAPSVAAAPHAPPASTTRGSVTTADSGSAPRDPEHRQSRVQPAGRTPGCAAICTQANSVRLRYVRDPPLRRALSSDLSRALRDGVLIGGEQPTADRRVGRDLDARAGCSLAQRQQPLAAAAAAVLDVGAPRHQRHSEEHWGSASQQYWGLLPAG
jgi:hypothetical protein